MSYCLNPDCSRPNGNLPHLKFCSSCGSKLLLQERYRASKQLGRGGFGKTFLAVDTQKFDQPCVIKQFLPQAQGTNTVEKAAELFKQEARRLHDLGHHSQIPELLAYFIEDSQQYLIQEYIAGQNLADELTEQGAFTETKITTLLNNLLPILEFIHERKVIHRDIKPENIIRRPNGELVLVDFGAAKQVQFTALSVTGTVIGTAGYAAPEQVMGKATYNSDIYSLGVTCLHLLTQVPSFELFDHTQWEWVWRDYVKHPVSQELGQMLDKMVESATKKRYQSATEVLQALQPTTPPPPPVDNLSMDACYKRGLEWYKQGEYQLAIADFDQAIQLNPQWAEAYYQRGLTCSKLEQYQQTIEDYTKALQINPNWASVYCNRGNAYYKLGQHEQAIADYDLALSINPNFAEAERNRDIVQRVWAKLSSDVGVDYTQLRNLLRDGKWREADEETGKVMLKASKREKEGWLREEDIETFSCTDLRTIDQLWVKYSNGRFGFSVQKRIWVEVGGTPEYDEKVRDKFGHRVGWRVKSEWLNYDKLNFSGLEAPMGHLPGCGGCLGSLLGFGLVGGVAVGWLRLWRGAVWAVFFSRANTCNL